MTLHIERRYRWNTENNVPLCYFSVSSSSLLLQRWAFVLYEERRGGGGDPTSCWPTAMISAAASPSETCSASLVASMSRVHRLLRCFRLHMKNAFLGPRTTGISDDFCSSSSCNWATFFLQFLRLFPPLSFFLLFPPPFRLGPMKAVVAETMRTGKKANKSILPL